MDNDDIPKGRLLSRREVLALLGSAGAALIVACTGGDDDGAEAQPTSAATQSESSQVSAAATTSDTTAVEAAATSVPACVVLPALTEGPYFVDEMLERSDIRTDPAGGETREGVELTLTLNVSAVSGGSCAPLTGAMVDIWHCDALGAYSDVVDNGEGFNTVGQKWLRGFQNSDEGGQVQFTTIYPGWYRGRATHIHFKIRKDNLEFTSQFFFDDSLSDQIDANESPYSEKGASGRLQNAEDNIYQQSNGMLQLDVQPSTNGYAATFDIGIQM